MIDKLKQNKKFYDSGRDVHNLVIHEFEASCDSFNNAIFIIVKTF